MRSQANEPTPPTREGDKPEVMLMLADCGVRDGLSETKKQRLNTLRLDVASAYERLNRADIRKAKTALLAFYQTTPEIRNGGNVFTPEQAALGDSLRLRLAVKKYNPNNRHPSYGDLGYAR